MREVGRRGRHTAIFVDAAKIEGNGGASEELDGHAAGKTPDVGNADVRVRLDDGRQEVARDVESCVGTVLRLGGEAHGGAVAAARLVLLQIDQVREQKLSGIDDGG